MQDLYEKHECGVVRLEMYLILMTILDTIFISTKYILKVGALSLKRYLLSIVHSLPHFTLDLISTNI